uniref:G-protein coupled receptors family 1 profile domain-containing protein n=1 Tax=Globodera rostochiensis TaxID=31243 RepID=A0A914GYB4_GLORO
MPSLLFAFARCLPLRYCQRHLALEACLQMLGELFQLKDAVWVPGNAGSGANGTGIGRCPGDWGERASSLPVAHNREHFAGPCTALELWTLRFVFPLLQLLCLGGNLFNLLVYSLPYFGDNSFCRLLEVLHAWLPLQSNLEWLYWHSRPWMITVSNLNGTISTWMTMFISLQTMVCVLRPFAFRRWCGRRPTLCCLIGSVLCAAGIHSLFLVSHEVVSVPTLQLNSAQPSAVCFRIVTTFRMRLYNAVWAPALERPYYLVQMSATIVLPTLVMMACTALVVSRFIKPQLGQSFSQRRKCVIRLTVATTVSHLLLEGPAALGYGFFALRGASMPDQREWMCALTAANNVLSALNATIPFFLFFLCSSQFRRMFTVCIQTRTFALGRSLKVSADDVLSQCAAGNHRGPTPSRKENERIERSNRPRQLSFGGFPVVEEEGQDKVHTLLSTPRVWSGGRGSETITPLLMGAGGGDTLLNTKTPPQQRACDDGASNGAPEVPKRWYPTEQRGVVGAEGRHRARSTYWTP